MNMKVFKGVVDGVRVVVNENWIESLVVYEGVVKCFFLFRFR